MDGDAVAMVAHPMLPTSIIVATPANNTAAALVDGGIPKSAQGTVTHHMSLPFQPSITPVVLPPE